MFHSNFTSGKALWHKLQQYFPAIKKTVPFLALWYLALVWTVSHNFISHPKVLDISYTLAFFAFAGAIFINYKVLGKEVRLFALVSLSTLAQFIFLLQQQPQGYTYDIIAHLSTIGYFAQHFSPQPITMGGESHQPPLYYALAGAVYWFTNLFQMQKETDALISLGGLNFFLFSMFTLYGICMIIDNIKTPLLKWLGIGALIFWPANLLHSFRISNDILLYLSFSGCIFHFLRWTKINTARDLQRSILWMTVAFGTKNSALLLPIMIAPLVVRAFYYEKKILPWAKLCLPLAALLLMMSCGLGRNVYNAYTQGNASAFEGKYGDPSTFIYSPALIEFDYQAFRDFPFTYTPTGMDTLFWNMHLRSMHFGEYCWNGVDNASLLNLFLLAMFGYTTLMCSVLALRQRVSACTLIYGVFALECIVATALMRMYAHGFEAWSDARHLYMVVTFFLVYYLTITESLRTYCKPLYWVGVFILLGHTLSSVDHIVLQLTYGKSLPVMFSWNIALADRGFCGHGL